jgi:hypothetical protein
MQISATNVRFLFDGERVHENQSPKDLNMENGDEIDVVIEQVGGRPDSTGSHDARPQ